MPQSLGLRETNDERRLIFGQVCAFRDDVRHRLGFGWRDLVIRARDSAEDVGKARDEAGPLRLEIGQRRLDLRAAVRRISLLGAEAEPLEQRHRLSVTRNRHGSRLWRPVTQWRAVTNGVS